MTRTYDETLEALGGLITGRKRQVGTNLTEVFGLMRLYLQRLGISQDQLAGLKVIHIAGTKGKGSTAAFTERILREAGYKTGLFTSPHLLDVRERIRICGAPVDADLFIEHFWRCYDRLSSTDAGDFTLEDKPGMPAYFRFLTLLGLQIFLAEKVDVAILEVGMGGRLDATNCVDRPSVCGITSLGMDHMEVLGDTLGKIAREKAGIMKSGIPAFTSPQLPEAQEVLEEVSTAVGAPLRTAPALATYADVPARLGLAGSHQIVNAALAVAMVRKWERQHGSEGARERLATLDKGHLPLEYARGLERTFWPGRGQVVQDVESPDPSRLTFFLDGAHTAESIATCADWYTAATRAATPEGTEDSTYRVLLFNCMPERDPANLLAPLRSQLCSAGVALDHALFVPPLSQYSSLRKEATTDLSWQRSLQGVWDQQQNAASSRKPPLPRVAWSSSRAAVMPNLQVTLDWCRQCVRSSPNLRLQVLVTGSLYMVGDMLKLLGHTRVK